MLVIQLGELTLNLALVAAIMPVDEADDKGRYVLLLSGGGRLEISAEHCAAIRTFLNQAAQAAQSQIVRPMNGARRI